MTMIMSMVDLSAREYACLTQRQPTTAAELLDTSRRRFRSEARQRDSRGNDMARSIASKATKHCS